MCRREVSHTGVDAIKAMANLKSMELKIDRNWKYDLSRKAATDLHQSKSKKVAIVPFARDLKIFKKHLDKKSQETAVKIKQGSQNVMTEDYIQLFETVYCRILLINRCRSRLIDEIELNTYLGTEKCISHNEMKLEHALTASELVLIHKCRSVFVKNQEQPKNPVNDICILFTHEVQEDINLLLSVRSTVFIPFPNNYLFGNPGIKNTIDGYKAYEKHARLAGTKNSKGLWFIRYRKYLATLA